MDKYEYEVRLNEINELIAEGIYDEAAEVADTIDWSKVRSLTTLCKISDVYKINGLFAQSRDVLLRAYDRQPNNLQILYSLCELEIRLDEPVRALQFYNEYVRQAPNDPGRYILNYKILKSKNLGVDGMISALEKLHTISHKEKWDYELASLYYQTEQDSKCVSLCDEIVAYFGEGKYVFQALSLKRMLTQLTPVQEQKYQKYVLQVQQAQEEEQRAREEEERRLQEEQQAKERYYAQESYPEEESYGNERYDEQSYENEAYRDERYDEQPYGDESYQEDRYEGRSYENESYQKGQYQEQPYEEEPYREEPYEEEPVFEEEPEYTEQERYLKRSYDRMQSGDPSEEESFEAEEQGGDAEAEEDVKVAASPVRRAERRPEMPAKEESAPEETVRRKETEKEAEPEGKQGFEEKILGAQSFGTAELQAEVAQGIRDIRASAFDEMTVQETDGQITLSFEETPVPEKQITGQIDLQQVMSEWEQIRKDTASKNAEATLKKFKEDTGPLLRDFDETSKNGALQDIEDALEWEEQKEQREIPQGTEIGNSAAEDRKDSLVVEHVATRLWSAQDVQKAVGGDGAGKEEQVTHEDDLRHIGNEEEIRRPRRENVKRSQEDSAIEPEDEEARKAERQIPKKPQMEELSATATLNAYEKELRESSDYESDLEEEPEQNIEDDADYRAREARIWAEPEPEEEPEAEEPEIREPEIKKPEPKSYPVREEKREAVHEMRAEIPAKEIPEEVVPEEEPYEEESYEEEPYEEEPVTEEISSEEEAVPEEEPYEEEPVTEKVPSEEERVPEEESYDGRFETEEIRYEEEAASEEESYAEVPVAEMNRREEADEEDESDSYEPLQQDTRHAVRPADRKRSEERHETAARADEPSAISTSEDVPGETHREKVLYGPGISIAENRKQIREAKDKISLASCTGNLLLTGQEEKSALQVAKGLLREIRDADSNFAGKVAKITGTVINRKDIGKALTALENGALIIEDASTLREDTIEILGRELEKEGRGLIVVLIDRKRNMDHFLELNPSILKNFTVRVDLAALDGNALVEYAKAYAKSQDYSIDSYGALALHTRIAANQSIDHQVTIEEVKDMVDEAISYASKKNVGHLMDIMTKKRYDNDDMIILHEKDFTHY